MATITIIRRGHEAATKRDRQNALRASLEFIGERHHAMYKMRKFEDGATRRYNLVPRSGRPGSGKAYRGSYTEAKVKKKKNGQGVQAIGEAKPFIWSGTTRESARASKKVEAKATSERGHVKVIIVARALNFPNKRFNAREEFERIHPDELKEQKKAGSDKYNRILAKTPPRTKRKKG